MHTLSRRTLVVLASLLTVVAVVVVAWWSSNSPDPKPSAIASSTTASSPAGSRSTPSASTASIPSASKPSSTGRPAEPTTTPQPRRVQVVTTFAGWNATSRAVEVGGYATVVERAGTCTLRLSHGDQVVTRKQTASADATTVACGAFSVPGSALTAGEWQAVLAYTSSTSTGKSTAVTVKVP